MYGLLTGLYYCNIVDSSSTAGSKKSSPPLSNNRFCLVSSQSTISRPYVVNPLVLKRYIVTRPSIEWGEVSNLYGTRTTSEIKNQKNLMWPKRDARVL